MKEEKPILFGPDMVRAILDGKKTQTRRPIKYNERGHIRAGKFATELDREMGPCWKKHAGGSREPLPKDLIHEFSGYYPVQKLWVRETFTEGCRWPRGDPSGGPPQDWPDIYYRADYDDEDAKEFRWKPSIFMPKSAARIWLEVTSVRAQRLEDLIYSECYKEGIEDKEHVTPWMQFFHIWRKMYGGGPYDPDENPWMWVIEFRRIKP